MKKLILLFLLWSSPLFAANYYVDCNADPGGDGSIGTPWDAIADVNGASFSAGDNVYLAKGCTFAEQLVVPSSGSSGSPITFGAYGTGNDPIIDGGDVRDTAVTNSQNYITFDGIHFTRAANIGLGNILSSGHHTIIQNCEISYGANHGIAFTDSDGDNLFTLNSVHDNGTQSSSSGIYCFQDLATAGHENYVSHNEVYDNHAFGIQIIGDYYIIENNHVYDNGNVTNATVGIELIDWGGVGGAHNIVRYNLVHGQISGGDNGEGIDCDNNSDSNQVYYNICYGNDGPGFTNWRSTNNVFYNNVAYGNCLNSSGELTSKYEFHVGESEDGEVSGLVIKNNILVATQADTYAIGIVGTTYDSTGLTITNNDYYSSATNWYFWNDGGGNVLATWNALTGVGTDLNSDPLFAAAAGGGFLIKSASPCKDAGTDVSLVRDYDGNTVPFGALPDIGAYEFVSSPRIPNSIISNGGIR